MFYWIDAIEPILCIMWESPVPRILSKCPQNMLAYQLCLLYLPFVSAIRDSCVGGCGVCIPATLFTNYCYRVNNLTKNTCMLMMTKSIDRPKTSLETIQIDIAILR